VATRVKPIAKDLYQDDLYAWAHDQAALLRAGRFDALDLEHLIEEVEDLAGSLKSAVRSRATTVMEHLLKLQYSPAESPRLAWRQTIRTQRSRLLNDLTPSLNRHVAERLPELYARARHDAEGALRDHGEHDAAGALPETCPYTLDQVTGDWLP
jgi:C4-dicarboxylate-specific signal transduction histidine kinase